jgi:hypothetical protein
MEGKTACFSDMPIEQQIFAVFQNAVKLGSLEVAEHMLRSLELLADGTDERTAGAAQLCTLAYREILRIRNRDL